jgi:capsular polysaccharide biosynthesis protein
MFLRRSTHTISRKMCIILLVTLIAVLTSACISFFLIKPVYVSCTTLFIVDKNAGTCVSQTYTNIQASQLIADDYKVLIKSKTIARAVIKQLGLKFMSPEELLEKVTVISIEDTCILKIFVSDCNPKLAKDIACKFTDEFKKEAKCLMKVDNVTVVDVADFPEKPVGHSPLFNIMLALLGGLIVGSGLAFIPEYIHKGKKDDGCDR